MTVIAWDGSTLAADRMAVVGGGMARRVSKISRHGDKLLAVCGDLATALEIRAWYEAGGVPADFPAAARDGQGTLVAVSGAGVQVFQSSPHPIGVFEDACAFGSGRDFAEAAMYLGRDAVTAVEVACHFQSDCGMGVDALALL